MDTTSGFTAGLTTGLTEAEALRLLTQDGPNELPHKPPRSVWLIAFQVIREPMFLLLLAAGLIYLFLGDWVEALILLGAVVATAMISIVQEKRTDNVLASLRDLASPRAWRRRSLRFFRQSGGARAWVGAGVGNRQQQRTGQNRQGAGRHPRGTDTLARPNAPIGQAVWHNGPGAECAGGAVLRLAAGRLAGGGLVGHHPGDGNFARGISADLDFFHGDGGVAHFKTPGVDRAKRDDRNSGLAESKIQEEQWPSASTSKSWVFIGRVRNRVDAAAGQHGSCTAKPVQVCNAESNRLGLGFRQRCDQLCLGALGTALDMTLEVTKTIKQHRL